ncbi:retinal rod rhodopsin-sensitive cgmp 3-cyclic phosphodiesterase subunit delta [Stylonychia lemnae]|uniref:Retinal rod rhodopsin-sensitive cgmp 3-cyclic phosphodiesterase subunit delta n=1 Tax=Stylonychia lemnae TaxID=5949 RepID=A0A078B3G0_STYLE|nr:retinal rod rhodopsin-sensitive cgmp 3-cyclic phosphodiesterase subunit delta [Stylonychia lemnae]|eukprot:CDW89065.1 retinal rod rhodopsin-sensitive cgmp 3-cyclic phosphodiesterase subunit delta [Stylonychia lemnae]
MAHLQDKADHSSSATSMQDQHNQLKKIAEGFKIVSLKMKNAANGQVLYESSEWDLSENEVKDVRFPKEMLQCTELSRELVFESREAITDLQLLQKISLNNQEIEHLYFKFGFVIPNSQNSWDQIIQADSEGILPAEVLSGNLMVETLFISQDQVINRSFYRVFYV